MGAGRDGFPADRHRLTDSEPGRLMSRVEGGDSAPDAAADNATGHVRDSLRREPELGEDREGRRRRPEMIDPEDRAFVARVALPAGARAGLDRDPAADVARDHGLAIRL